MSIQDAATAELVDKACGGGAAANELFARCRSRLQRMVQLRMDERLNARLDPSDVVQEAMMIAAKRLPEYCAQLPMAFYPWMRQIVWSCLVDFHRRHIQAERRTVDREARSVT